MGSLLRCSWCVVLSVTWAVSLTVAHGASAQSTEANDPILQAAIEPLVGSRLPALWVAVVEDGEVVASAALGVRRVGHDEPVTIGDTLHLGSCTKAMTATLIGRLVEQGKLDWDDCVADTLPDIRSQIAPQFHDVTVLELLTHRSGVPENPPDWWLDGGRATFDNRMRIVVDAIGTKRPARSEKFRYSNLGYMIAGLMAEKVTGQSWEELLTTEVFEPLGIRSGGFGVPGLDTDTPQPWGHREENTLEPVQLDNAPALGPAGTVHMTIGDWARFVSAHFDQADSSLITADTRKLLHTPSQGTDYACGWGVTKLGGGSYQLSHSGSNTFWYSTVWAWPRERRAVLVVSNVGPEHAEKIVGELGTKVAEKLFSGAWSGP
jgi:CubicO group peptidase (beta-lactamase class C family)